MGKKDKAIHLDFAQGFKSQLVAINKPLIDKLLALDLPSKDELKLITQGKALPSIEVFINFKILVDTHLCRGKKHSVKKRSHAALATLENKLFSELASTNSEVIFAGAETPDFEHEYILVAQYRVDHKLTFKEMADLLGCKEVDVVKYERNLAPMPLQVRQNYVELGAPKILVKKDEVYSSVATSDAHTSAGVDFRTKGNEEPKKLPDSSETKCALPEGKTFGERIKAARKQAKISQSQLATAVFGLPKFQMVYKLERNLRKSLSKNHLRSLAEALNLKIDDVIVAWELQKNQSKSIKQSGKVKQESPKKSEAGFSLPEAKTFGELVKKCRNKLGLTQSDVSKKVFCLNGGDACLYLEKNRRKGLTADQLNALSRLLKLDSNTLEKAWKSHLAKATGATKAKKMPASKQKIPLYDAIDVECASTEKPLDAATILCCKYSSFEEIKNLLETFKRQAFSGKVTLSKPIEVAQAITCKCIEVALTKINYCNESGINSALIQYKLIETLVAAAHSNVSIAFLKLEHLDLDKLVEYAGEVLNHTAENASRGSQFTESVSKLKGAVKHVAEIAESFAKTTSLEEIFKGLD